MTGARQLAGASDNPMESVSFNFTELTFKYSQQKDDGSLLPAVQGNVRGTSC